MADTPNIVAPVTGQVSTTSAETQPPTQMDAFARKERQIRKMQIDIQKQKQELEQRAKSYETDYIPRSKLKEDPWSVLQSEGLDYDQLTQQLLQQPQDPATKALMTKIRALEEKQTASERAVQENTQAQYTQALKQISNDARLLVDSDPTFETIKGIGQEGIDAITELIEQTFQQDGVLMDTMDAAKKVEEYLVEQGMKFSQFKKVQERLKPKEVEAAVIAATPYKPKTHTITTLSRQTESQPAKKPSEQSRREKAMAAFLGKNTN